MKQSMQFFSTLGAIIWMVVIMVYSIYFDSFGQIHILFFLILLFYALSLNWKILNNAHHQIIMAALYPFMGIIITITSVLLIAYIPETRQWTLQNQLGFVPISFVTLILLSVYMGGSLSLSKITLQLYNGTYILISLILIWKTYESNLFTSFLILAIYVIFIFSIKQISFLNKVQINAILNHKLASDDFWIRCYKNPELGENLRLKSIEMISDEKILINYFLKDKGVRKYLSEKGTQLLNKVKKWENRLQIMSFLSDSQRFRCIEECDDVEFLNTILKNDTINIIKVIEVN